MDGNSERHQGNRQSERGTKIFRETTELGRFLVVRSRPTMFKCFEALEHKRELWRATIAAELFRKLFVVQVSKINSWNRPYPLVFDILDRSDIEITDDELTMLRRLLSDLGFNGTIRETNDDPDTFQVNVTAKRRSNQPYLDARANARPFFPEKSPYNALVNDDDLLKSAALAAIDEIFKHTDVGDTDPRQWFALNATQYEQACAREPYKVMSTKVLEFASERIQSHCSEEEDPFTICTLDYHSRDHLRYIQSIAEPALLWTNRVSIANVRVFQGPRHQVWIAGDGWRGVRADGHGQLEIRGRLKSDRDFSLALLYNKTVLFSSVAIVRRRRAVDRQRTTMTANWHDLPVEVVERIMSYLVRGVRFKSNAKMVQTQTGAEGGGGGRRGRHRRHRHHSDDR